MANAGDGVGVWTRVAKTTIAHWSPKIVDSVMNYYPWLMEIQRRGRIKSGLSGGQLRWVVKYKRRDLQAYVDASQINFVRSNLHENAFLPWRGCHLTEMITDQERQENRNKEAMVRLFESKFMDMQEDAQQLFAAQLWDDGNGSTATNCTFHGAFSFLSTGTQTNTDAEATSYNDTYANLSTALGGLQADSTKPGYDAWSPTVISTNKHDSGGTPQAWADFADEYIRKGLLECYHGGDQRIHMVFLTKTAHEDLLNLLAQKERLVFSPSEEKEGRSPGFGFGTGGNPKIVFDGAKICQDEAMPATDPNGTGVVRGVGINFNHVDLCLLGPKGTKLFRGESDYDINQDAVKMFLKVLGNLKFKTPRSHLGLIDLAATA